MTAEEALPIVCIEDFSGSNQTTFFKLLKQPRFSGQLILSDCKGQSWIFYIYLGRITYATGGPHSYRSWKRNILTHCPHMTPFSSLVRQAAKQIPELDANAGWQQQILSLWVEQQKITREQVVKVVRAVVIEALFDVTQARQVSYQIKQDQVSDTQLALLDAEQIATEVQALWKVWQAAKIADRSPNAAPVIRQPQQLEKSTSASLYQALSKLLNGQRTLRDLALQMKRDVVDVTRSLLPYVQRGFIELVDIPDLTWPIQPSLPVQSLVQASVTSPLIVCIDDSPVICQSLEEIIKGAQYEFLAINDPLRAIALLMSRKPALIFLDLVMPNANGYEICGQLRKLTIFKETPIVILTGQDGIVDRVRAKLVGASDFLSKPVEAAAVLGVIRKHLRHGVGV
ncbi:response regulator [Leptolyngbya sp. NK1-12]|uniref:Response regulator n=1 Tax=Leptolyngbya sp. NK1-12 TaxID=2547451 RepID=A0AA97AGS1_9CYAN|nr:response regulator [Leptolyngbya sp. NK1-12]